MTKNNIEKFDKLREEGYRITSQRKELLNFFYGLSKCKHLSAEELHKKLTEKGIKISLATLYRNLKFLVKQDFIKEIDFGEDHKHYELNVPHRHHHHLICNICGLTIEFEDKNLSKYAVKIAKEQNNFEINDYQFKIFGICEKCAKNKNS